MTSAIEQAQDISIARTRAMPTFGYYRQPNGWITVSPVTDLEQLRYMREGWTPLPHYGRFEMATEYAANHPLEMLLMQGGAKELCVDQILANGLHLNPPLVPTCLQLFTQFHKRHLASCWAGAQPARFPQLEGMTDLGPFPCRFCGDEKPTVKVRDQHENVKHRTEKTSIRMGDTLSEALVKGLKGTRSPAEVSDRKATAIDDLEVLREEVARLRAQMEVKGRVIRRRKAGSVKPGEAAFPHGTQEVSDGSYIAKP